MAGKDQKTDGKGTKQGLIDKLIAALSGDDAESLSIVDADLEADETTGTSTETEGDKETTTPPAGDADEGDESGDDDSDDADDKAAKKPKTFTQEEVNAIVAKRIAEEKNRKPKMDKKPEPSPEVESLLKSMEARLAKFEEKENAETKKKFEKLPAEVRELAPVEGELDTPEKITAVADWMPKGEKLAKLLAEKKVAKPGNGDGPRILSDKEIEDEKKVVAEAKKHSIYQGGL
jgi:hypothetical protein